MMYVIELETSRTRLDDDLVDETMDRLIDHHPSIGRTLEGEVQITIRLASSAGPLLVAETAQTLVSKITELTPAGVERAFEVTGLRVLPERIWDGRNQVHGAFDVDDGPGELTVAEAAEVLSVSAQRVRQLIEADQLLARRRGGRWMVDARSVHARSQDPPASGRPASGSQSGPVAG